MSDWRLTPENAAIVAVDLQEKLMAAMARRPEVTVAAGRLVAAGKVLRVPVVATLQYVKGLGPVCAELTEALAGVPSFEKLTFSCCGNEAFVAAVKELRRPRIILCGVETHVCVQQTAIDLLNAGYAVYVCADAVCSRRDLDGDVALARLRDCGAAITTVESAVFEMLRAAGTAEFKACLPLWK
jgi:nicotinamidase-related amidase